MFSRVWPGLLVLSGLFLAWSAIVFLTGGFVLSTGSGTLSSTHPTAPFIAGGIGAGIYLWRRRENWKHDVADIAQWRWAPVLAGVCTFVAAIYAIEWGIFFGAGPDQSGYVSQADGWVHGQLTWALPDWARNAHWHNALWSSAPVGYKATIDGVIAPTYSPGFPLMMALFQLIGGRDAVFYVVPLLGATLIWITYRLGVALSSESAGAIAAVLMLCSPTFIDWLSQPMSDIPVTTLWSIALLLALGHRRRNAIGAGIATALAILVRPNIAPLAIVPALLLLTERAAPRWKHVALFVLPSLPAIVLIAILNARWWGSPLTSGYGDNSTLYAASHIAPNLRLYLSWLVDTQSPMVFAGLLAPLVARDAHERQRLLLVTVVFPVLVLAMYLPYMEFDYWVFLRFLLPAFPAVLAGFGAVVANLARRTWDASTAAVVMAILTICIATVEWRYVVKIGATRENALHQSFARAVEFARTLPRDAVLVSSSFSGTLHFYTGRDVLRYDVMWAEDLDGALDYLRTQGRPIYFIGHGFEVDGFKNQFRGSRTVVQFDHARVPMLEGFAIADLSN